MFQPFRYERQADSCVVDELRPRQPQMTAALTYISRCSDLILALFARMLVCNPESQNRRRPGGSDANRAVLPFVLDSGQSRHRRSVDGVLPVASQTGRC